MGTLLALHLVAALLAPVLMKAIGRNAFVLLALVPGSAAVWALGHTTAAFSAAPPTESYAWIPGLDLSLVFRLDPLSWLMTVIVGGVGALVLVYCSAYFTSTSQGLGRFAGVFTGFAGAMLGVVVSDHTIGLYVFWELTSILSFLLIGHHHDRRAARAAARQAVLVTTSGSLAMFAGFVMWGQSPGGSYRISELVDAAATGRLDVSSPVVVTAALLVLVGAATKSALAPAHFWLPGAMAAPTPVSAYLHAAAMVKAGVYLVARLTPGLTHVDLWSPVIVTAGLATMLVGGWRALRQYDLKLVLAYGTVSQLGLITAAVGQGSAAMMAAGLAMLVAHACFKSSLFLTVGAVESATGTRDLRELSGLWRHRRLLAASAAVAAASMAGVPFTAGYLGKEAALTALLHGSGAAWTGGGHPAWADVAYLVVLAAGSTLTVAYSWRLWWGAFATKRITVDLTLKPTPPRITLPIVVLACGAFLGLVPHTLERALLPHGAPTLPGSGHLAWWSGWGPALVTAAILGLGAAMAWQRPAVSRIQRRLSGDWSIIRFYSWTLRELELIAGRVTGATQRGSLPWDLSIIVTVFVLALLVPTFPFHAPQITVHLWDTFPQLVIAVLTGAAAIVTVRSRRRLRAAFGLGACGAGVALLFATQGAPDLALTQLVVEAVTVVVFVLVLRELPRYFSDRPLSGARWVRMGIAVTAGVGTVAAGLVASAARVATPVSQLMPAEARDFGNGLNIVNVILVDIRAWDTVGELSVLLVTATGVASLIYLRSRSGRIDRAPAALRSQERFLPAAVMMRPSDRSVVLEVATRLLFPTMIVLSVWLLLVGHNNPGGGFAGGVVAGLAFVLRYLAGGRHELGEAMPIPAGVLMGAGLFVAATGGALPLLFGNAVLESVPVDLHIGGIGDLHFTTAMVLDVGVYLLVMGLVLDLVSALGAEIDRRESPSELPGGPR